VLVDAGFGEVIVDKVSLTARSPSIEDVAIGLVRGNPVVNTIQERGSQDVETIVQAVASALRREFGEDPLHAPTEALVFLATS
jgi:hypothetical protein